MEKNDTLNLNNTAVWIIGGVVIAGGGFAAYYFLVKKKKDKPGYTPKSKDKPKVTFSSATSGSSSASTSSGSNKPKYELDIKPFSPTYKSDVLKYTGKSLKVLKEDAAKKIAKLIDDAWGFWDDDEDAVYAAFRQLKDKVQVSQVVAAYQKYHSTDLWGKLESKLSSTELETVTNIVDDLPNYRIA